MKTDTLYKENLDVLQREFPVLYPKVAEWDAKNAKLTVENIQTPEGREIPMVTTESGRKLILNGYYGEQERIEKCMEKWGRLSEGMPIFFYGIANYAIMKRVYDELKKECVLYLYEPSMEIFDYYLRNEDLEEMLTEWPIYIEVGEYEKHNFENAIARLFQIDTLAQFKMEVAPNYAELFPENMKDVFQLVDKKYRDFMVGWRTAEEFTDVVGQNMLYNISHMLHGYNVLQLKGKLNNQIPAIVVSAGPSLNKNIQDLKPAVGKACIIAVDTAIKPLLNNGIKPDFFVIVDGKKPTELMAHPGISDIPLVTCTIVASGIMDLHRGKKFFYTSSETFESEVVDQCTDQSIHKENMFRVGLATGGSVANTAFSLARFMDAKEIILVGQDLALTDGKTHADGTFQKKMQKLSQEELDGTIWVDGIRGNKVRTRLDFARYLRWFEEAIEYDKLKNVTDATQGGAKIHGTKVMTLKRAVEKYCVEPFDMQKKLEEIPEMMDYAAKLEFVHEYQRFPEGVQKVIDNAEKASRLYAKMEKLVQKGGLDKQPDKIKKLSQEITKLNTFMNEDKYALFVQLTMVRVNFTMRMGIYQNEENDKDNLLSVARQGHTMNQYILACAKGWHKYLEDMLKERPLSVTEKDLHYPVDNLVKQLAERRK